MPEFDEILDNFEDNFKENIKKPWFKVALGVVVALGGYALYKSMTSDNRATETSGGGEYFIPTGYASGYPEYNGGMGGGGDYYDGGSENYDGLVNYLDNLNSKLDATIESSGEVHKGLYDYLDEMQTAQDTTNNAILSQVEKLGDKIGVQESQDAVMQESINRQNIISEMKANSEFYNGLESGAWDDVKNALHDRNMALADEIGATYDEKTGTYVDNSGSVLYTTTPTTVAPRNDGYTAKGSNNPAKIIVTGGTNKNVSSATYASDSVALAEAGRRWNEANAAGDKEGMAKAHADAEAIRAQYGYKGGDDGSQVIKI